MREKSRLDQVVEENHPVVIVLNMGKVGSTSVVQYIRRNAPAFRVLSAHYCSRNETPIEHGAAVGSATLFPRPEDMELLKPALEARIKSGRDTMFISGVRNPIDRIRSAFLQNLESHLLEEKRIRLWMLPWKFTLTDVELSSRLNAFETDFQLRWFERELEPITGIDIYSNRFDDNHGFMSFSAGPVKLFLYKFEALGNESLTKGLNNWLRISSQAGGRIPRLNELSPRMIPIREALMRIPLDPTVDQKIRESRLFQHFYGQAR